MRVLPSVTQNGTLNVKSRRSVRHDVYKQWLVPPPSTKPPQNGPNDPSPLQSTLQSINQHLQEITLRDDQETVRTKKESTSRGWRISLLVLLEFILPPPLNKFGDFVRFQSSQRDKNTQIRLDQSFHNRGASQNKE